MEIRPKVRQFGRFLLITLVRGVLFLVPIVIIAILGRDGYQIFRRIFQPVARLLPEERFFGILSEDLVTIFAIVLVFLIAGLFVGTRRGRLWSDYLERGVLYRLPGYLLVRGAASRFPGLHVDPPVSPALVATDEGWAFALLVERLPTGYCTVFLPDAPSPTSGAVRIVEASRVHMIDTSMLGLLGCLTRSGVGAGDLAAPALLAIKALADEKPTGDRCEGA
ncbi:hypothetical protein EP7_002165 [Isosphaeraceae bacterium EP7]